MPLLVFARKLWWLDQEWLGLRYGRTIDQRMVSVHGTPCTMPPHNSNQYAIQVSLLERANDSEVRWNAFEQKLFWNFASLPATNPSVPVAGNKRMKFHALFLSAGLEITFKERRHCNTHKLIFWSASVCHPRDMNFDKGLMCCVLFARFRHTMQSAETRYRDVKLMWNWIPGQDWMQ
jgi:hypothetical protein